MKTRVLVYMALFVALDIVLTRLLALMPSTVVRISLSFVAYAVSGVMFGPWITALTAGIGDIVGMMMFPNNAPYFIGFTISAVLTGFCFGFLKNHRKDTLRLGIVLAVIAVVIEGGLNTYWLTIMQELPFGILLAQRSLGILVNCALRVCILIPLLRYLPKNHYIKE